MLASSLNSWMRRCLRWNMIADPPALNRRTLHTALLPRVADLRRYVDRRIPRRFSAAVSADDILQEVWIAAYRTVSTFVPQGPGAIDRWLVTIAKSKTVDAIRAARRLKRGGDRRHVRDARKQHSSLTGLFARLQSPQKTPSADFGAAETAHAISIALNSLRADRRRAICLHYIEGRSHRDIACELDKTEAAVNSLLYNGLRELRSLLGEAARYFSDVQQSQAGEPAGPIGR